MGPLAVCVYGADEALPLHDTTTAVFKGTVMQKANNSLLGKEFKAKTDNSYRSDMSTVFVIAGSCKLSMSETCPRVLSCIMQNIMCLSHASENGTNISS